MSQVSFHPSTQSRFIDQLQDAFYSGDPEYTAKSAEDRNVKTLIGLYEAIARGDLAAATDRWDDQIDFELIGPPGMPMTGRWQGKDEVAAAVARNFASLEDQEAEVVSLVAQGDTVVVFARERGKVRSTGKAYDCHWVQFYTFANDKIKQLRSLVDTAALREAAH